jgi:hypothetical protein
MQQPNMSLAGSAPHVQFPAPHAQMQ